MNLIQHAKPKKHIALHSSTPQQGKSTVAKFLANTRGYMTISFAAPLLEMVETFLIHHGLDTDDLDYYCRENKEELIPCVARSYRYLARTLGTEWGRELVDPRVWLNAFEQKFDRFSHSYSICNDDLRFKNEADLLRSKGFLLVKIMRDAGRNPIQDGHQSDLDLSLYEDWDYVLENDGTLEDLYAKVNKIVS